MSMAGTLGTLISEVPFALAVFHRGLAELVVAPSGAAFGDPGRCDLFDDLVQGVGLAANGGRQAGVPDRAVAHGLGEDRLPRLGPADVVDAVEHPLAFEDLALVG